MKKIALTFALLLFISLASASNSIKVKTLSDYKTSIYVLDGEKEVYSLLESYHLTSNSKGLVSATYTGDTKKINVLVVVKDAVGTTVLSEKFGPYNSGVSVSILATPDESDGNYKEISSEVSQPSPPVNLTSNATLANDTASFGNVSAGNSSSSGFLSGFAIGSMGSTTWTIIIIAVAILAIVGAFFGGMKFGQTRGSSKPMASKVNFRSSSPSNHELEQKLISTQRELRNSQTELNKLRNRDKIVQMEKNIADEQRTLNRLKHGE